MRRKSTRQQQGSPERAYLVAVDTGEGEDWTAEDSLQELAALAEAAGALVVGSLLQKRPAIHPNWYLGRGKAAELREAKQSTGFNLLVADDELSPKQQQALEDLLDVKVLDRSGVILDVFAQRAHTHEGRLQVELAQLEYQLPRLTRLWTHLSRTGAGIGTRGPGEQQLETDRRVIRQRVKRLKARVGEVRVRRETAARARNRRLLPAISIVGYTNAGKSTLLNALVGAEVAAAEDKLFATLDPTSRRVRLPGGQTVILTDTVGFIHKLPHQLIDAFRATLEEVTRADVLIEVVDVTDPHALEHRRTVQSVLDELRAGHKPRLVALNKIDLLQEGNGSLDALRRHERRAVPVSARTGAELRELVSRMSELLGELWMDVDLSLPYTAGALLARARERGAVDFEYRYADVRVRGQVSPLLAEELRDAARAWSRAIRGSGRGGSQDGGCEKDTFWVE